MKRLLFFSTLFITLIFARPVSANDCLTAQTVIPGQALNESPVAGTFLGATFSGETECSGSGSNADVWFKFQATATQMFVRTQTGVGDMDLVLEVRATCAGSPLACVNNAGPGGTETASLSGLSIGNIYYARVYRASAAPTSGQNFTMAVSYIPTVELKPIYCGILDYTTNDIIKSTQPVNTDAIVYYQWRFQELDAPFDTYEIITETPTNPNFRLEWFAQIGYGRSYDVSVRLAVNPGATVGTYGSACTIKLQDNVLSTQLETQYAGGFFGFCDVIGCDPVGGADRYRWEFNDLVTVKTVYGDGDERLLRISKVPGIELGKTYVVTAFAELNGQESPAGTMRFLNTENLVPNTGLRTDLYPCGGTYPLNSQVQAIEICRAQTYTWRFKNTSTPQADLIYTRTDGNRFIRLEWVTGLIAGDSYDLDIKARQGNKNGDYSSVCNITIAPSTSGFVGESQFLTYETSSNTVSFTEDTHPETVIELSILNNGKKVGSGLIIDLASADVDMDVLLELYNLNGKLVASRREIAYRAGNKFEWQIAGFTPGIYILRATNGSHIVTKKVTLF